MKLSLVLRGIEDVASREILRDFRPDSCIAATKIIIRVLRRFGYEAQAIPARLVMGNRAFTKLVEEKGVIPSMEEAIEAGWFVKHGAWSVGIGYQSVLAGTGHQSLLRKAENAGPTPEGKWNGHVVAFLPRHNTLIDASITQGNRPAKGIVFPGVLIVTGISRYFLTGEGILRGEYNGCLIEYRPFQDESFRRAPDWTDDHRVKRAVKAIVKYIETLR